MSDIPEARRQLVEIANELRVDGDHDHVDRIIDIVEHLLVRRSPARGRMPTTSNDMTPEIRRQILELARSTQLHNAQIAARVGVNPGRVSEVLQGDR